MMFASIASPARSVDISLVAMPCWTAKQPSHALSIVGAIARASGVRCAITDINILFYRHVSPEERKIWDESVINLWLGDIAERLWTRHERWLNRRLDSLLEASPTIVAFTVNMWTRHFSVRAARYIKKRAPQTVILFGGVDCFIGEHNLAFLRNGDCDIICQGEAEVAFPRFLTRLGTEGWRTTVPGFAYHDDQGRLVNTGRVDLPTLKDPQPPHVLDAFDLSLYEEPGRAPFFFSRGCPFTCRFCSETTNFSKFRCRVPKEAFDEAVALAAVLRIYADPPTLDFSDSIFNAHINHLLEFARLVIDSGISVTIGAQGHFHHTMTKEVIDTLAMAGVTRIFWGFESGSQKVIDLMKKAFQLKDAIRIIRDCSEAGIHQYLPVLVGFPGESPEDFADTVEFIIQFRETPGLVFFQPSPVLVRANAELHERYTDFGLANNEVLHWSDITGENTYPVRLARCFVASQAQGNATLTRRDAVCLDYLAQDLNSHALATDLFHLLRGIFSRSGGEAEFSATIELAHTTAARRDIRRSALIDRWQRPDGPLGMAHSLIARPDRLKRIARFIRRRLDRAASGPSLRAPVPERPSPPATPQALPDPIFQQWLATDKNSPALREIIIEMTLNALRRLRHKHHPPS